jgi:hypothetical protein
MKRTPDFDELVGDDLSPEERERLERVHELLVTAGPPPELTPEMERGPTLAMTLGGPSRRRVERRVALLAAAVTVLALAFLGGYLAGHGNGGSLAGAGARTLKLIGTAQAPGALAALRVQEADPAGNWPMTLTVTGLPSLPPHGYYEVFLTRNGKVFAPCGTFLVKSETGAVSVQLNAPYHLHRGDGWVVTRQLPGQHEAGLVVMKQLNA